MQSDAPLIMTIGWGLVIAFGCGFAATKLKLSPLLGYLLAGVVLGPYTPGVVADRHMAEQAAEIGIMLLMFGVGLHFSPREFAAVRGVAVIGAIGQIAVVGALSFGVGVLFGFPTGAAAIFGLALSIASTIVALRELEQAHALGSPAGQITIGWLVAEDLVTIVVLVALPVVGPLLQSGGDILSLAALEKIALSLSGVVVFVGIMLLVGRRVVPWFLALVAATGSRELFTLATLSIGLGISLGAASLFGVSVALGAFLAGVVLSESELSHQAAADALPFRDAFAVLFFVSVGMLFDPMVVLHEPVAIVVTLILVVVLKPLVVSVIVLLFRYSARTALAAAGYRAQVGEFSFVLIGVAAPLGLADRRASDVLTAVALISIALAPVVANAAPGIERLLLRVHRLRGLFLRRGVRDRRLARGTASEGLTGHVVLIGHGRSGSIVAQALAVSRLPFVVIEQDGRLVAALREGGLPVVYGNAASDHVLRAAGIAEARLIIITSPDAHDAQAILAAARAANPDIDSVIRVHNLLLRQPLLKAGAGAVVVAEHELAYTVCELALQRIGLSTDSIADTVQRVRAMDR